MESPKIVTRHVYKALLHLQSAHMNFLTERMINMQVRRQMSRNKARPNINREIRQSLKNFTNLGILRKHGTSSYAIIHPLRSSGRISRANTIKVPMRNISTTSIKITQQIRTELPQNVAQSGNNNALVQIFSNGSGSNISNSTETITPSLTSSANTSDSETVSENLDPTDCQSDENMLNSTFNLTSARPLNMYSMVHNYLSSQCPGLSNVRPEPPTSNVTSDNESIDSSDYAETVSSDNRSDSETDSSFIHSMETNHD